MTFFETKLFIDHDSKHIYASVSEAFLPERVGEVVNYLLEVEGYEWASSDSDQLITGLSYAKRYDFTILQVIWSNGYVSEDVIRGIFSAFGGRG